VFEGLWVMPVAHAIKLTKNFTNSLIALLAILSFAVGMPLLHPALHNHIEDNPPHSDCGVGHFSVIVDKDQTHECPICGFLATSQLNVTVLGQFVAQFNSVCCILSKNHTIITKTFLLLSEPRAPPVLTSL
jgi:hypothetical protein